MSHPLSHNGSVKEAGEFALLALSWQNKEKGRSTLAYFSSPKCSSKKVKFKRERGSNAHFLVTLNVSRCQSK